MKTKPTEKRAAQDEAGNLQDMRRFHDVFEICHPPAGKSLPSGIRQPVAAESASASILQPVAGESGKRFLVDFSNIPTCWRKTLHEPGRLTCRSARRRGSAALPGSWSQCMRKSERRLLMNRPKCRKVLDCASPLALWTGAGSIKRWRATAVQDATAPTQGLYGSKRESFRGILSPERRGRKFKP